MRKVGYTRINKNRKGEKPARCASCGEIGSFRVTFKDDWGKLIVTLCKDCAWKKYDELHLQSRLDWPVKVKITT